MSNNMDAVSGSMQPTVSSNKKVYEVVVDPDRAHLGESFVFDLRDLNGGQEEEHMDATERSTIADTLLRKSKAAKANEVKKVGRAIPNIHDINYSHPANPVPVQTTDLSPKIKVTFDMSGIGSITFKYHNVITLKDQIILVTDKRYGGSAEFYPYCNMRKGETKKPVGVHVQGDDRVYLLNPDVAGFPIRFDSDPYEFCIVPIAWSKNLNSDMIKELGIVESSKGAEDGEAGSNQGRANSAESGGGDISTEAYYESAEGGIGGVL